MSEFDGARDVDGDGAIEVSAGVTASSRIRHTRSSAIWVFPEGTKIDKPESVASGAMKDKCLRFIDVGATPEQGWHNQNYDKSDVSFAWMRLDYAETIAAGPDQDLLASRAADPSPRAGEHGLHRACLPRRLARRGGPAVRAGEGQGAPGTRSPSGRAAGRRFLGGVLGPAAQFEVPDPILNDIFLSRLATRAILEVNLNKDLSYNTCSPFFYFDHAYRDGCYVILAWDMAGMHDHAEQLLRVYCKDVKDVPKGPIAFDGKPLQLGMLENGLWNTRPGQWDTQGQNIWALVQHYKLSGDRAWLEKTAYPYIRRGAMWIVNSRHKHMAEVKDPKDPRYGLIEPGAMEVMDVGKGTHMYYLNAFGVLGLREAADAAKAVGAEDDARLFAAEGLDLKNCLHRSFQQTFKRTGLYEGHLWFGVEPEGVGHVRVLGPQLPRVAVPLHRSARPDDDGHLATHGVDERQLGRRDALGRSGAVSGRTSASIGPSAICSAASAIGRSITSAPTPTRPAERSVGAKAYYEPDRRPATSRTFGPTPTGSFCSATCSRSRTTRRSGSRRRCSAAGTSRANTSPSRSCRPISAIST